MQRDPADAKQGSEHYGGGKGPRPVASQHEQYDAAKHVGSGRGVATGTGNWRAGRRAAEENISFSASISARRAANMATQRAAPRRQPDRASQTVTQAASGNTTARSAKSVIVCIVQFVWPARGCGPPLHRPGLRARRRHVQRSGIEVSAYDYPPDHQAIIDCAAAAISWAGDRLS